MSDVLQVTDENFEEEIINSEMPAMVDFWAEWCGPCKMVSPLVEELAQEYKGDDRQWEADEADKGQFPVQVYHLSLIHI